MKYKQINQIALLSSFVKQKKNWGNITQEMLIKNSKEKNEKIETLKQEIENKSNGNEQLWEEIGEREEYIMNTNILSMTNDLEKIKNENEELWDNIFEKQADRQSLQEKTDVLSKQKLDLQKKVSKLNK